MAQRPAVAETEQRKLLAFKLFFHHERTARRHQLRAEMQALLQRMQMVAAYLHALATGESVVLNDMPHRKPGKHVFDALQGGETLEKRVALNAMARQQ